MEISFFFGMFCGGLLASLFWVIIAKVIRQEIYSAIIQAKNYQNEDDDEDSSANFWKPKGWKPDE